MDVRHGGCFNCGNGTQPVLKSVMKPIINRKGERDTSTTGLALCDACVQVPVIDMRLAAAAVKP